MKLAFSNIGFKDEDEQQVYSLLSQYGFTGLEIAPSKFIGANPYDKCDSARAKAAEIKQKYGLVIPSMQSIWYGQSGNIFNEQEAETLADYTDKAVLFAKAVGCKSLVFGCPKNRYIPDGKTADDAIPFFERICAFANENGVRIALEANPTVYGTNFINETKQAFAFAKKVDGLYVNYDLGTAITNNENFDLIYENICLISHVHISEPMLAAVTKRALHYKLADMLCKAGYKGYVSIEMKTSEFKDVKTAIDAVAEAFA